MSSSATTSIPITCRPLSVDESVRAVEFLTPIVHEVPIFKWILGERSGRPEMVRLMAELLIAVALPRGRVLGAFEGDELVGIIVWAPAQRGPEEMPDHVQQRLVDALNHDGEMALRMQQHQAAMAVHQPKGPHAEVLMGAIVPHRRGGDIVAKMVVPVFASAAEQGAGVTATTASLELGAVLMRRYGAVQTEEFNVGPVTLNVYTVAAADVPH